MDMDLGTCYNGDLLVDDWIIHTITNLQKIVEEQVQFTDDITRLLQLAEIQKSSIEAAFEIAENLQLTPDIKYTTIFLYDEFLHKHFINIYSTENANGLSVEQLNKICFEFIGKIKLYLLSCYQLTCKMNSFYIKIEISEIINILQDIDSTTSYTDDMIISSEYEVFKTVGFRIPVNTPLTCIEILLAVTNHSDEMDHAIALQLLDTTFLQREELYTQFHLETTGSIESVHVRKPTLLKSDMLFLSAAIVACTMLIRNVDQLEFEEALKVLAEKSLSTVTDITTMANILGRYKGAVTQELLEEWVTYWRGWGSHVGWSAQREQRHAGAENRARQERRHHARAKNRVRRGRCNAGGRRRRRRRRAGTGDRATTRVVFFAKTSLKEFRSCRPGNGQ